MLDSVKAKGSCRLGIFFGIIISLCFNPLLNLISIDSIAYGLESDTVVEKLEDLPVESYKVVTPVIEARITEELEQNQDENYMDDTIISYYCACDKCCGKKETFITASGMEVWNGMEDPRIVACNWLPLGSEVEIDGELYTVRDTGSHIRLKTIGGFDIFEPQGHSVAKSKGLNYNVPVRIVSVNE